MHAWFLRSLAFCSSLIIILPSVARSEVWVCDAKSATGFTRENEYRSVNFRTNNSYIIRKGINPNDLSLDFQKNDSIFQNPTETYSAASIQAEGAAFVTLCKFWKIPRSEFYPGSTEITCEGTPYDMFKFNLITGRYTKLMSGWESEGGVNSYVEVGECRRTM